MAHWFAGGDGMPSANILNPHADSKLASDDLFLNKESGGQLEHLKSRLPGPRRADWGHGSCGGTAVGKGNNAKRPLDGNTAPWTSAAERGT